MRFFVIIVFLFVAGCESTIPKAYRGQYVDEIGGVTLSLKRSKATVQFQDGKSYTAKKVKLDFDRLVDGEPGMLFRAHPSQASQIEIFWIIPDLSTRGSQSGYTWYGSEVFHTTMDMTRKSQVTEFRWTHSKEGMVLLDTLSRDWQVGWAPSAQELRFVRN